MEREPNAVDSFFGDEEDLTVESARSLRSPTRSSLSSSSSVSSSSSTRSRTLSGASSDSGSSAHSPFHSAPSSGHSSPRDSSLSSAASTARSDSSDAKSDLEDNNQQPDTDVARGDNNNTQNSTQSLKKTEEEEEKSPAHAVEIGAGDANILTVNIPSGTTPRKEQEESEEEDLTDVSSMATPRPVPEEKPTTPTPVKSTTVLRPKSAHPNKGRTRKASTASSVASKNSVNSFKSDFSSDLKHQSQIEKHRERLLYNTGKSSKDINQLLEAVLVLDEKGKKRERSQNPNPFPSQAVGSARRRQNFKDLERQKEIQKENDRLLKELTRQRRRPTSAVSVTSGRSRISNVSTSSKYSTASAMELRRTSNCKFSPVARNYHSKINRERESRRIDNENLALLRRLQNVKPSVQIQVSRQAVSTTPIRKTRPKNMRPKIVNTWTDGW